MEQQYCNLSFGPPSSQPFPGMQLLEEEMRTVIERSQAGYGDKKKMNLTSEQRNLLEKAFTEGFKLDPARRTILSMELGLDPRQVAVWFQNRRARWKARQLELSYHSLKLQLNAVCEENRRLQHEVLELRAMLMDPRNTKQICNEVLLSGSDNEAVRKMLAATVHGGSAGGGGMADAVQQLQQPPLQKSDVAECQSYMLDGLDDIQLACYWAVNYPPC